MTDGRIDTVYIWSVNPSLLGHLTTATYGHYAAAVTILGEKTWLMDGGANMTKYIYIDPLDDGYKQFKLTKKQHNSLFKYRQIKWHTKYEYYYNEHMILLHRFYNKKIIILTTILFPIAILFEGISNIKECYKELRSMYNQKKYGSFSGDSISKGTETYEKIMEIINKKESK